MIFNKKEYLKKYRLKNKEKIKEQMRLYRLKHKEQIKEYEKQRYLKKYKIKRQEYYLKNKKKINKRNKEYYLKNQFLILKQAKEYNLKKKYGLTTKQYEDMIKNQNYECNICSKKFNNKINSLKACVDHDHETGKIRSILCNSCNGALGFIKENIIFISNMKDYLYKHKTDEQIEKYGIIKPEKKLKQLKEKIKLVENQLETMLI
jgi:hypothetical protein